MKYVTFQDGSVYARARLCMYYAQRLCISRRLRQVAARATVLGLRLANGRPPRRYLRDPAPVGALRMQGFVRLPELLTPQQCADMLAHVRSHQMVAQRGSHASFDLASVPDGTCMADYRLDTVVNCPHVMELANHPDVLAIAAGYLGYTPTITLISMRWSFAGGTADIDVQNFHRDAEPGTLKLLVYLTDVDEDSGPHRYVAGSHRDRMPLRLRRYSDGEVNIRHGGSTGVLGPAGTAVMIDSKGIHKGSHPARGARLLLAIQYSLLPCFLYEYTPVQYHGRSRFDAYINRLMIAPAPRHEVYPAQEENIASFAE